MAKRHNGRHDGKHNGKRGSNDAIGSGGEPHQRAVADAVLTTNQGVPIADDQNMLRVGARGPALLEDFHFLEKMTHFDHERIPERIVHARGSAAHGTFRPYKGAAKYTRAAFLQSPSIATPVFVRFSTVAGGAGSVDLPRDVRGFATKFYTTEGNFDLVGNNIPVFFIQDAIKFPDFVHAVKMEPDRGYPQNGSAHDTFWDFVSLVPETQHMVMWTMSDRALPRSFRMMEGFGVNTFRMVDARGKSTFIKWHWRPVLGSQSVTWDEAVKICGADQDFHRRDLFTAIQAGQFPEYELSIQPIAEEAADELDFDILDATKLVPEEIVPLVPLGKMVLDRWPDNFFAETEQAAFHPGHLVPGIDLSDDPLLQGRIFSYTDTQLKRLGGPNFHEIEINRPKCPMANFQRDGMARMKIDDTRVSYEPNSLAPGVRETPHGFVSHPAEVKGNKVRERSATFADHYSQPRMFYRSMSEAEQRHIVAAYAFELSKVETVAIRTRQLGHLHLIDPELGERVAETMGMVGRADVVHSMREPIDLPPSPALSILGNARHTLVGRKIGCLIADGFDGALVDKLRAAVTKAGAMFELVAPRIGASRSSSGRDIAADHIVGGGPSVIFDAVAIVIGEDASSTLVAMPTACDWVRDAWAHCKVMGVVDEVRLLLEAARVVPDDGVIKLAGGKGIAAFVEAAERGRIWSREQAHATRPKRPGPGVASSGNGRRAKPSTAGRSPRPRTAGSLR